MMLIRVLFLLICSRSFHLHAQPSRAAGSWLSGTIGGYANAEIFLLRYDNSRLFAYEASDSTRTDSTGYFRLRQPSSPGMYRVCQGRAGWYSSNPGNTLHLWLGFDEEVAFQTKMNDLSGSVRFSKGRNNTWWFANERYLQPYMERLGICMQLLDIYPAGDFYARVQQEYLRVQEAYKTAWARLAEQQPANRLLDEQRRLAAPFTGGIFTKQDRIRFWQQHFLDSVDLSSSTLQASHLLGQKLEQYMGMFGYPYAFGSRAAMDSGLLVAVKGIIDHCKNGSFSRKDAAAKTASLQFGAAWLYNFCTDKALDQCLGYTAGQLTEDVFTNTCNASPGTLQTLRRMQASQRLKPGMAAPEIALNGAEAKRLTDIKAGRTLVLFWASWCPHCQQELPLIKKLYDSTGHKGWEVLAVSIDTSGQAWAGAVAAGGYGWLNYCDRQGWDSPSAKDYGVFVTPAMYLLDEKKQIVARPATVEELKKWLSITEN